jgi:hypothetical protein
MMKAWEVYKLLARLDVHEEGVGPVRESRLRLQRGQRVVALYRRNIRLLESRSKCRHLQKLACKGTLLQVFNLSEAQNPIPPPPLHTYTCIQYTYSHREGGGGEFNQKEGERGNSSKSWVENTNLTDCISSL